MLVDVSLGMCIQLMVYKSRSHPTWFEVVQPDPRNIPMAPDTMEKEATHKMLIQALPFTDPSVHTSGDYVDQQVDG